MSKLAMHISHFTKDAVGGLAGHNWYKRGPKDTHSNQDIDPARSKDNIALVLPESGSLYRDTKTEVEAAAALGRVNARSIWVSEWIVYPPEDLQDPQAADPEDLRRWGEDVLDWMRSKGIDPKLAVIHLDETTAHMHIDTVPRTPDGRLSRKELYTRARLGQYHTELAEYLAAQGWDVQRGESTKGKQTRSVSVPEYKKQAEAAKQAALAERDAAVKAAQRLLESSRLPKEIQGIQPKKTLDGAVKLRQEDYQALYDTAAAAALVVDQVEITGQLLDSTKESLSITEEDLEREQRARARAERDLEAAMRLQAAWELERSVLFQIIRLAVLMIDRDAGLAMDFRDELYKESTKSVTLGRMDWRLQEKIDQLCGTRYAAEDKARYFAAHPAHPAHPGYGEG